MIVKRHDGQDAHINLSDRRLSGAAETVGGSRGGNVQACYLCERQELPCSM